MKAERKRSTPSTAVMDSPIFQVKIEAPCESCVVDSRASGSETKEGSEGDPDEEESEFEFKIVATDSELSGSSMAYGYGRIAPVYPIFSRELYSATLESVSETTIRRLPLFKLLQDDRNGSSLLSSATEVDDLDGIPPEIYCAWSPMISAARGKKKITSYSIGVKLRFLQRILCRVSGRIRSTDGKEKHAFVVNEKKISTAFFVDEKNGSGGGNRR